MSSVNDEVVRQYLELLGFLVVQPRKYLPSGRVRRPEEEMDLLAYNPRPAVARKASGLLWTGADLKGVSRLLVSVRGWHTERFGPALLEGSPEILRFAGDEVMLHAERWLGGGPVVRVLCVPALPVSVDLARRALALLRENGVNGVLSFRTMLVELCSMVDVHRNYDRSDLLQTLRILKAHGMLHDAQLPLFSPRRRRSRSRATRARGTPGGGG